MSQIITIAGSPSGSAKSSAVLNHTQRLLRRRCVHTSAIAVRDLPPADLVYARLDSPAIQEAHLALEEAQGVIISTPVYKSAYSGVLKAFLDLLPQNALQGKVVLPIATGGASSHLLALDYALKPVLAALGACHILHGVYITDEQIQFEHGGALRLEDESEMQLRASLEQLIAAVAGPVSFAATIGYKIAASGRGGNRHAFAHEAEYPLEGFER
jgi:FMN reductase